MLNRYILTLFVLLSTPLLADQIWDARTKTQISSLSEVLENASLVVSGETHYDPATVAVHAQIARLLGEGTVIGWEFLNIVDQPTIAPILSRLQAGELSVESALGELFPGQEGPVEYAELLKVVAEGKASLIPTNLTRAQKQPVTKNGIEAVDPALLPPNFAMGSDLYFQRFQEAMGPHPLPSPIENYFASQCLTDDVMAYALLEAEGSKHLLVTGSFHGDFKEGVVARLQARAANQDVVYIKIAHRSEMGSQDIGSALNDPKYGMIADVLYVIED